jgi:hypothetical protein
LDEDVETELRERGIETARYWPERPEEALEPVEEAGGLETEEL